MSREDFLRIPELAINPLGDRIVNAFFEDSNATDTVNFRQFMQVLARFRPIKKSKDNKLNSREQKLQCTFSITTLSAKYRNSTTFHIFVYSCFQNVRFGWRW